MALIVKSPKHRRSARRQTKPAGQPCTCSAAKCQTDPRECLSQAAASSSISLYCPRQAFREDTARAAFVCTEEPACLKQNVRPKPCPRQIGDFTSVTAVHPRRMLTAAWTRTRRLMGAKFYLNCPMLVAIADQVRV